MNEPLPLAIDVTLPLEVEDVIAAHVAPEKGEVWTTIIHGALWEMRARAIGGEAARRELEQEILVGLESSRGEGREVTPEFWREFKERAAERGDKIRDARSRGLLANLLLPEKLFAFVNEQVASGRFSSPSQVVTEAVRSCSWNVLDRR